jgi:outer membrane murein-binding lipoprotein Lpp
MTKKTAPEKAAADAGPHVRTGEIQVLSDRAVFAEADAALADYLGLDLTTAPDVRAERAVLAYNSATRSLVEAGLLLASVKRDVSQEAFIELINQRGMHKQRAYSLMNGAALAARLPEDQREQVLALGKSKVLALGNASPEVVDQMLEEDDIDINALSVRDLRARLRELEAEVADTAAQRDAAEAEATGLKKKLAKTPLEREDAVPVVVADLRAEFVACTGKVDLALKSIEAIGPELVAMVGGPAHDWVDGTARLAVSGLVALRMQIDGVLRKYTNLLPDGDRPDPVPSSYLSQQELAECADAWKVLAQTHTYEQDLRAHQREQERPRGRGRPSNAPKAPKA